MRGLTTTIILVVVLAGLGGYIYFVDSARPATGVEEKDKVFAVEAESLEEITVTTSGESTTLRKTDGTWKIVAPVNADADANEVSGLTSALTGLEVNRVVDENATNLAEYGLADPRLKIAFKATNGVSGELHIGDKSPTQSDMYAVKPGEKRVFLVPAFQETSLAKNTFSLRDKRILHFDRDKVDVIEVNVPGSPLVQVARTGTDWVVKAPIQARGDYSAIEALLTRLATAPMTELVDPNSPQTFGLEAPTAVVTVGAGSARAALELGAERDGKLYARDRERQLIFAADPSLASDLKKTVDDLRDKDLFEFRSFNATRLRLTRGKDSYEFQKVAGTGDNASDKWQRVVDGKATDVDLTKMEDFLTKLAALRAQSFNPTTNAAGTADAALVAEASYDTDKFERVRFIRGEKEVFGVRDGEPGVAVLDQSSFDETMKALDAVLAPATS
jgi:hypothetical protein